MIITCSKQEENRKIILHNYARKPGILYSQLALAAGVPKSTAHKVISRYLESGSIERKRGSGRKVNPSTNILQSKINSSLTTNPNLSLRDLAIKCNADRSTVKKTNLSWASRLAKYKKYQIDDINRTQQQENEL